MSDTMEWKGVIPALTTCFKQDLSVDHDFIAKHVAWLVDNGCTGIVVGGSLGEGATLSSLEKLEIIRYLRQSCWLESACDVRCLFTWHPRRRRIRPSCRRQGSQWSDGPAPLCLSQ